MEQRHPGLLISDGKLNNYLVVLSIWLFFCLGALSNTEHDKMLLCRLFNGRQWRCFTVQRIFSRLCFLQQHSYPTFNEENGIECNASIPTTIYIDAFLGAPCPETKERLQLHLPPLDLDSLCCVLHLLYKHDRDSTEAHYLPKCR